MLKKDEIEKMLQPWNKAQVVDLLAKIISSTDNPEKTFLQYCKKNIAANTAINKCDLVGKEALQIWSEIEPIVSACDEYGGCDYDEEDEASSNIYDLTNLLQKNKTPWGVRKKIMDDAFEYIISGNNNFVDELVDLVEVCCKKKDEWLYMAHQLEKSSDYYRKEAAKIFLKYKDDDKYLELMKNNLRYDDDFANLAGYYLKKGDIENAEKTAWQGMRECEYRKEACLKFLYDLYCSEKDELGLDNLFNFRLDLENSSKFEIQELMYNHFSKVKDYHQVGAILEEELDESESYNMKTVFEHLQKSLKKTDYENLEPLILEKLEKNDELLYLEVLMKKREYEVILDILEVRPVNEEYEKFKKALEKIYPERIAKIYWNDAEHYANCMGNENYNKAKQIILRIKSITQAHDLSELWAAPYQKFVDRHRLKRNLMNLLKGIS